MLINRRRLAATGAMASLYRFGRPAYASSPTPTFIFNFAHGSDRVAALDADKLKWATEIAYRYPQKVLELTGHIDGQEASEGYADLSLRRAVTVRDYFFKAGVDGSRVVANGVGATRPNVMALGAEPQNRVVDLVWR